MSSIRAHTSSTSTCSTAKLYDHQIPPSAAAVVHYQLDVPADARQPIEVDVRLQYRKFTRGFTKYALGPLAPSLPVTTIASDRVVFPIDRPDGERSSKAGERSAEAFPPPLATRATVDAPTPSAKVGAL